MEEEINEPAEPQEPTAPTEPNEPVPTEPEDPTPADPTEPTEPVEKTVPVKALQAEVRKRQELETRIKELETRAVPKRELTIEDHFDANPANVLGYLDSELLKAKADGDWSKVEELRDTKTNLVARGLLKSEQKAAIATTTSRINAEIYKAVPDFDAKKPELQALAQEYGLTEAEARDILDPNVIGETAARMAQMLNRIHSIANAGKTAKAKEVKTPTKVEAAGNGGFSNNDSTKKQFNRAKESGHLDDWAAVLG